MNWITAVATTNQWVVIWLVIALVSFIALYVWDIVAEDPTGHGAGVGNPIPMLCLALGGTLFLIAIFLGGGYVVDWVIWMWNN